jgi:putative transposase
MSDRPRRLDGFSYVGPHRYFLTFCAAARSEVFTASELVASMLSQISQSSASNSFAVFAYCFMPDHLHLLVEGMTEGSDLIHFARDLKQRTGFHYKAASGYQLWQKGYYEHVLRADEATLQVARYIWANPVTAGLVREPAEYPYSGSLVLDREAMLEAWRSSM